MDENQSSEVSKPEQLPDSKPETDHSSLSIEAPSKGASKTLDSEGKSFSELLAGAIASPTNSKAPVSFSVVPTAVLNLPAKPMRFMQMPLDSPEIFQSGEGQFGISHQQALANVTAQAVQAAQKHLQGIYTSSALNMTQSPETSGSISALNATPKLEIVPVVSGDSTTMPEKWQVTVPDANPQPIRILGRPVHDVYNWRKYGQKQVKGSEFPRSYYKCTHLGCSVKKMVVCTFDGHVTEIIYKGEHNHEPPPPKRVIGFSFVGNGEGNGGLDVLVDAVAGGSANGSVPSVPVPSASRGERGALDVLVNVAASGSVNESEPSPSKREQVPANATAELVPVLSDHEEDDNAGAKEDEVNEDEPDPKRRNTENKITDMVPSERAVHMENKITDLVPSERTVREPRVVVQTTSDLEILYDGYRWRKYGQKTIKGSPNPRSYYKCTNAGCPVRKHVERSSSDPKSVITTYEGKHNHDIPGSKHSIYVPHAVTKVRKSPAPTTLSDQNPSTRESLETEIRGVEKAHANGGEIVSANNPTEGGLEIPNAIQDGEKANADNQIETEHNHDQCMELDSNSSEADGESKSPNQIQRHHVPVSVSVLNT